MRFLFFLMTFYLFAAQSGKAAVAVPPVATDSPTEITSENLTRAAVEDRLGRKLTFKERIGLSVARGKVKRAERRQVRQPNGGRPTDGFAIAALVCGILGLVLFFPAIPAFVFGIISLGRIQRDGTAGKGMAIAGIVLGALGILILGVLLLIAVALGAGF